MCSGYKILVPKDATLSSCRIFLSILFFFCSENFLCVENSKYVVCYCDTGVRVGEWGVGVGPVGGAFTLCICCTVYNLVLL